MGVHFKPGGAFPFLGMPADALVDGHVDLEDLWGARAGTLRERLSAAAKPVDQFRVLEEALLDRLRLCRRHPVVQYALARLDRAEIGVRDLVRSTQLSHRQFIELFRAEVGMAPKLFTRVRRFERAAAMARRSPRDWAKLAATCGYFDQSHMIGDFVAFSGLTPVEYGALRCAKIGAAFSAMTEDVEGAAPPHTVLARRWLTWAG